MERHVGGKMGVACGTWEAIDIRGGEAGRSQGPKKQKHNQLIHIAIAAHIIGETDWTEEHRRGTRRPKQYCFSPESQL
jgi:hypothetical protein